MTATEKSNEAPYSCVPLDDHFFRERQRFRASLANEHPLAILADEHTHILCELSRLELALASPDPGAEELRACGEVSAFLLQVEPHHRREEQVLFPALRARGIEGPPAVMEAEHVRLRSAKEHLRAVAEASARDAQATPRGWEELRAAALPLIASLRAHVAKEDAILYPLAQRAIEPGAWAELRTKCDEIGYCCHRPTSNSQPRPQS